MYISDSISNTKNVIKEHKSNEKTIGFVPTMGALHEGHLSLIRCAKAHCDIVVVSIYINPTQFNNAEDLSSYPKTLVEDIKKLESVSCDILFTPTDDIMYPEKSYLSISFGELEDVMEGAYRPGHFGGVGQIVTKLFNIVQPNKVFFGQKDFQQLTLIKRLVKEYCFPIEIIGVPITREENGLAMSSRNERLNEYQREEAKIFYDTLLLVKENILSNPLISLDEIKGIANDSLSTSIAKLEYFEVISDTELEIKTENYLEGDTVLCIAGFIGNVRLIDNMYLIL